MPEIDPIELETHRDCTALRLSNVEKFSDGSGYRCDLYVRSDGFTAQRPFCFDELNLSNAIESLRRMVGGTPAEATLRGPYENDFVRFKMDRLGHVIVSGELYEHSELSQSMKFAFQTDQTVLPPLLDAIKLVAAL